MAPAQDAPLASVSAAVPQRELRMLVEAIQSWLSGLATPGQPSPSLAVIEGSSGFGQAEILEAFAGMCRGLGMQVLHSRAWKSLSLPTGVVGHMAARLLEMGGDAIEGSRAGGAEAPGELHLLAGGCLDPRSLPDLGSELNRSRLVDAFASALFDLGRRRPVILCIEGIDDADPLTMACLEQILRASVVRRSQGCVPRVFVLVTTPDAAVALRLLRTTEAGLSESSIWRVLARGYSREDLHRLVPRILGVELPVSFRERLARATGGGVTHAQWVLRLLRERGVGPDACVDSPLLDLDLSAVVRARFEALDETCRRAVRCLALHEGPLPVSIIDGIASVTRTDPPTGAESSSDTQPPAWAGRLEAEGFLSLGPLPRPSVVGRLAIPGPFPLDAIPTEGDGLTREALRAAVGTALADLAVEDPRLWPEALRHLVHSSGAIHLESGFGAFFTYLERLGSEGDALPLLDEILSFDRTSRGPTRFHWLSRKADALARSGDVDGALNAWRQALGAATSSEERALCHRRMGDIHGGMDEKELQIGEYDAGLGCLDAEEGEGGSVERLKLLASLAQAHTEILHHDESLAYLDRCMAAATKHGPEAEYRDLLRIAEEVHFRRNAYVEAEDFERALLRLSEETKDVVGQIRSLRHSAHLARLRGGLREAEACLVAGLRVATASGSRLLYARVLSSLGAFETQRNEPGAALKRLREARRSFLELGESESAYRVGTRIACLELELGQFQEAARTLAEVVDEFLSRPLGPNDETEDAVDPPRLETVVTRAEAVRALEKKLGPEPGAWAVDDAVSLEVLLEDEGRHAEAEAICRACLQRTDPDGMRVRTVLLLAMGRIHRRRGQVDAALKWLEQALQAMEKSPSRTILLEIHLEVSGLLRERGEILRAFDHALRGLRTAFECGKTLGLAHAILELTGLLDETGHEGPAGRFARAAWELARGKGLLLPELRATRWILELGACGEKERESLLGSWRKLGETVGSAADSCTRDLALGRFAFAKQSFAEALASAKAALDVARSAGLHPHLERGLLVLAAVEGAPANPRKNFLRAREVLEQVVVDAETRGYPRVQFEALEQLSKLYEERGKGDYAEELAAKARNLAHRVFQGLPPVLVSSPWRTSLEGQGDPLLIGSGTPAGAVKQSS